METGIYDMYHERRRHDRQPVRLEADLQLFNSLKDLSSAKGPVMRSRVVELSPIGVCVLLPQAYPLGTRFMMRLMPDEPECSVISTVRHVNHERYSPAFAHGCEIVAASVESVYRLLELVTSYMPEEYAGSDSLSQAA
jgi:hypothetical protein